MHSVHIQDHYAAPRKVESVADPSGEAIVKSPVDSDTVLITCGSSMA